MVAKDKAESFKKRIKSLPLTPKQKEGLNLDGTGRSLGAVNGWTVLIILFAFFIAVAGLIHWFFVEKRISDQFIIDTKREAADRQKDAMKKSKKAKWEDEYGLDHSKWDEKDVTSLNLEITKQALAIDENFSKDVDRILRDFTAGIVDTLEMIAIVIAVAVSGFVVYKGVKLIA